MPNAVFIAISSVAIGAILMNRIALTPDVERVANAWLLARGLRYIRSRWRLVVAISALMVVPCYWHPRIGTGDFASHTYNAWLAQLISQGHAPGLYIANQWNNVLVDLALLHMGGLVGFIAAEKFVSAACVLIFFWGAFAFITAATLRPPWFLTPAIAMISYGYTFYMGFMNFYLSLGLGFLAAALFWRGKRLDWIAAAVLAIFTLLAHPLGLACLTGIAGYIAVSQKVHSYRRWILFTSAFVALFGLNVFIRGHYRYASRFSHVFYFMNGTDQLVLFGPRYIVLACIVLISVCLYVVILVVTRPEMHASLERLRTPLELWSIMIFAAAMIPEFIWLPQYGDDISFGYVVSRLTSVTAVLGLCALGCTELRKGHLIGFAATAAVFFGFLYQDTGASNRIEEEVEQLVHLLPYGRRVLETTCSIGSRVPLETFVDSACLGRCFSYSNYEPATHQFRIRALRANPIVSDSRDTNRQISEGRYVVRKEDLPISGIYPCDPSNLTKLCIRELKEGEKNGGVNCPPR